MQVTDNWCVGSKLDWKLIIHPADRLVDPPLQSTLYFFGLRVARQKQKHFDFSTTLGNNFDAQSTVI